MSDKGKEQSAERMELTEAEWKELENSLSEYRLQKLEIDGYNISLRLEKLSRLQLGIAVYVNGYIKHRWCFEEGNPIREKFFWKRTTDAWSRKMRKDMKKILGKREAKKQGFYDKVHYYSPYFKSFGTLKRTFKSNNKSIIWIKD